VVAGPANAYSHYVATREEYGVQRYEGASTIFGPCKHLISLLGNFVPSSNRIMVDASIPLARWTLHPSAICPLFPSVSVPSRDGCPFLSILNGGVFRTLTSVVLLLRHPGRLYPQVHEPCAIPRGRRIREAPI